MTAEFYEKSGRRTQKDRSEATQRRVLNATLTCIAERGYAAVSLQDIATEAGVSRGAITHHYARKSELTAAAIDHFFSHRFERFLQEAEEHKSMSLSERMDLIDRDTEEYLSVGLEILVALKADEDLRHKYAELGKRRTLDMNETYSEIFPEFRTRGLPGSLMGIVINFYRGLFIESVNEEPEKLAAMKASFKDMIRVYVSAA